MAIRYHYPSEEEVDDIVIEDVKMFRMEQMGNNEIWLACYFYNGERVAFWINPGTKPARAVISMTEEPKEWIDIDDR